MPDIVLNFLPTLMFSIIKVNTLGKALLLSHLINKHTETQKDSQEMEPESSHVQCGGKFMFLNNTL